MVPTDSWTGWKRGDKIEMACYHPLKAFIIGVRENGKLNLKICSYETEGVELPRDSFNSLLSGEGRFVEAVKKYGQFLEVPCGRCVGCRLAYSRDWANRCMLELADHDSAYFVTLTYDDAHIPRSYYADSSTGEASASLTLLKRDCQLFMKRLREKLDDDGVKVRFYLAGEYGEDTYRPHYHAIIFGLQLNDLVYYKKSKQGYNYFVSEFMSRIWKKGLVVVGEVTWETCAYTARYVMKKLKGEAAELYERFNIEPPFVLMSRRPGIGRKYYDDHDVFEYEYINISTPTGGKKFKPPRYYKKLYEVDDPEGSAVSKEHAQRFAKAMTELKLSNTSLNYTEMLEVEERTIMNKMKVFKREFKE